jgi:hypothetical protein
MVMPFNKKYLIIGGISIAAIISISVSIFFFLQYQKSQALLKNPADAAKVENKDIAKKIALLVDVPLNEEPTVAAVSDADKLREQPFFAKAKNGDRVVFYASTKRAILYRPSTNKIIEMSPVNVTQGNTQTPVVAGATAPSPTVGPTPTPEPKSFRLAIYNGTTTPKLANNMEKSLNEKLPIATVVKKDNATKSDYNKTLIIDLTGTNALEAKSLMDAVEGSSVVTLPSGEAKPDADILLIIGANWKP